MLQKQDGGKSFSVGNSSQVTRISVTLKLSYMHFGNGLMGRDMVSSTAGICFLRNPSSLLVWRTHFFICFLFPIRWLINSHDRIARTIKLLLKNVRHKESHQWIKPCPFYTKMAVLSFLRETFNLIYDPAVKNNSGLCTWICYIIPGLVLCNIAMILWESWVHS